MKEVLRFIVSLILVISLGYVAYLIIAYLIGLISVIDKQVAASIIVASGTVLAAVGAALYVQRRTKEREIFEAHRPQKIEVYKQFMEAISDVLRKSKDGQMDSPEYTKSLEEFFINFTRDLIVWGSPSVIRSYENFRLGSSSSPNVLLLVDDVLREIRGDLGNSNVGIKRGDLIKLFLKDPNEIDKLT
jgi:hypothetical protein